MIETGRCVLRPLQEADRDDVYRLYQNEDVRHFLGGVVDRPIFNERFDGMLQAEEQNWAVRLRETGEFVGLTNLAPHHDGEDYELSYQLLPNHWGRGLAQEILEAAISYASRTMGLNRIVSETQKANIRSIRLLKKIGMSPGRTVTRFGNEQIIYQKFI